MMVYDHFVMFPPQSSPVVFIIIINWETNTGKHP